MEQLRVQLEGSRAEKPFLAKLKQAFWLDSKKQVSAFVLCIISSILIALLVTYTGIKGGALFIVGVIALPVIYAIISKPKFGILVVLVLAYLLSMITRLGVDFPVGTLIDGIEVLLFLGFFLYQKQEKNWSILKGPISTLIVIWIVYNILEVANPVAESRLAWLYTVRSVAVVMLMYFIFVYHIRTIDFVRLIIKLWIALSILAALYALKQEFIGFSAAEEAYLNSDPSIQYLLFIDGHWRKFSIFTDPVTFSYNMVVSSLLCISLIAGPFKNWKKIVLGCLAGLFLFAMLFSGTRGAYVLLPAALVLFAILKYNRKVMFFTLAFGLLIAVLVVIPTSNATLYRFQSAFKPSNDASFNLRKENQKKIQPYILSHPIGGGLGATGVWGSRFAPHSFLANFPPDSGYVRVAVEMGWVGLFLFCLLMFTILRVGINNYYRMHNAELKTYCMAMVLIIFAFNIGNFPQEAIVQFPSNIYFFLAAALIVVTARLDKEKTLKLS